MNWWDKVRSFLFSASLSKETIKITQNDETHNCKLIHGNCLEVLDKLFEEKGEFVDLIFCDPPYFLQLTKELRRPDMSVVEGVKETWDKFSSYKEYDEFTNLLLCECK